VFLNQAVLGPVVVATFFGWSMTLTGRADEYPAKMRSDAFPALKRGWAFWVPAASVNFALVPLKAQVLYMSCCSIVWNYILSTAAAGGSQGKAEGKKK
jgi:protein Mpv17